MDERTSLIGTVPDKARDEKEKMNDRYLTGLVLLLTVVVVSLCLDGPMLVLMIDVDGVKFYSGWDGDWR
jgi:hypothetical protein